MSQGTEQSARNWYGWNLSYHQQLLSSTHSTSEQKVLGLLRQTDYNKLILKRFDGWDSTSNPWEVLFTTARFEITDDKGVVYQTSEHAVYAQVTLNNMKYWTIEFTTANPATRDEELVNTLVKVCLLKGSTLALTMRFRKYSMIVGEYDYVDVYESRESNLILDMPIHRKCMLTSAGSTELASDERTLPISDLKFYIEKGAVTPIVECNYEHGRTRLAIWHASSSTPSLRNPNPARR